MICLYVSVCEEASANIATEHLSSKMDEIPASVSAVSQLLISEKCTLSM